jgi:4-carboxymuconolactone decarboxylase
MTPLRTDQWDPSLQYIIDDMQGHPIQIHCLLANHPTLLKAWWSYRMYSVRGGELQQRECELVILRVAVHMETWYEWAAHVDRGLTAGLTLDEVHRVAEGPSAIGWSRNDSLLLSAIDQLIKMHGINADTRVGLAEVFSEKQILDIVSLQGLYVTIACIIGTWPVELEEHIAARLPDEINEEAFRTLLSATNSH